MTQNTILLLQAFLIFLQLANSAVDTLPQPWPVIVSAFVGAFQWYVQHLGNQSIPEAKP
jgi:hypothetical protein